ncbi:phosphoribosyl pyrophosphokinase [Rozella allomycis CSF55]|uniref:Phosphoribosyl pyrophosphokinase n=1 Tax=Rozella allomycis (strain CSF55) TaxID=988480 RepID=A0A075AR06_ROZAC|nr:Ribose-phosphate diphosphokinase domain-containing protein [Rozella allomycis CSF55]RKP22187.1 phosphoribosyl pyrophosphokinase [Rozella allomycis CSF55]|eukprot:EPZ31007.1 Ribose-phosphate diphosphokinase domain-containing protein [Rozella allomycis CSF55]
MFHGIYCVVRGELYSACVDPLNYKLVLAPLILYILERIHREISARRSTFVTKIILHPSQVMEIQMRKVAFKSFAGQYVFLNCPDISKFQWHPFTLTSCPKEDFISVHMKIGGDWTFALANKLGMKTLTQSPEEFVSIPPHLTPKILIDGPYGAASDKICNYKVVLCVGAEERHRFDSKEKISLKKVYFVAISRDTKAIEDEDHDNLIEIYQYLTGKLLLDQIHGYLAHGGAIDGADPITGLHSPTYFGRPNFDQIFQKIKARHTDMILATMGPSLFLIKKIFDHTLNPCNLNDRSFIKQIASATGDLSSMSCPSILLSGQSLTEYSAHWMDHPDLFILISSYENSLDRMIAVVRWFVSQLYGAYASRWTKGKNEKKPYNPILGELFFGSWETKNDGEIKMCCEQVSHHPPVTAFYFENKESGTFLVGNCGQKTKFTGTAIKVEQTGSLTLYLEKWKEEYTVSFPELHLRGIMNVSMFLELTGNSRIVSSSGLSAFVDFIPKPWFSGEYHTLQGYIFTTNNEAEKLVYLNGKWTEKVFHSRNTETFECLLFDAESSSIEQPKVKPIEEQSENETFKVWSKVTEALKAGDYNKATKEKNEIEEKQRSIRRSRQEKGEVWVPSNFHFVEEESLKNLSPGGLFSIKPKENNEFSSKSEGRCSPINDNLMELLLMIAACKESSAKKIIAVMPYFPYSKHSKKKTSRETIAAKLVADMLEVADLHTPQIRSFFNIPVDNLLVDPILSKFIVENIPDYKNAVVVAKNTVTSFADMLCIPFAIIHDDHLKAENDHHIYICTQILNFIFKDDIIDCADTFILSANLLKQRGATDIYIIATHGVLSGDSLSKINSCGDILKLLITNSLPVNEESAKLVVIDMSHIISEAIRRVNNGESISFLFHNSI